MITTTQRITTLLVAVLLAAMFLPPATLAQKATYHANGAFALASYYEGNPSVYVYVSRYDAVNTWLYYDVGTQESNGNWLYRSGYGPVPNSSFIVKGNVATMSVDTSKLGSDFGNVECTNDPATGEYNCVTGNGGAIAGVFTAGKLFSGRVTGTSTWSSPGGGTVTNGTSEYAFGTANVNVLGVTFISIEAQVGTNHNTTINIVKK